VVVWGDQGGDQGQIFAFCNSHCELLIANRFPIPRWQVCFPVFAEDRVSYQGEALPTAGRLTSGSSRPLKSTAAEPQVVGLLLNMHLLEHIENDLPLSPQTVYNRRMDIVYQLQGVEFEWDEAKARSNIANHGVTFEEAVEVFFDPFYQGGDASTEDEAREFIIGYSLAQRLLLVVYVDRGERTRIISARQATRSERKLYEEA
jgi:uncharacterized DUF497 family protein